MDDTLDCDVVVSSVDELAKENYHLDLEGGERFNGRSQQAQPPSSANKRLRRRRLRPIRILQRSGQVSDMIFSGSQFTTKCISNACPVSRTMVFAKWLLH